MIGFCGRLLKRVEALHRLRERRFVEASLHFDDAGKSLFRYDRKIAFEKNMHWGGTRR